MTFKNLLVLLDSEPASAKRLDAAIALAQAHDAHLSALALSVEIVIPAPVMASMPMTVLDEQRGEREAVIRKILEAAKAEADKSGVMLEMRMETVFSDQCAEAVARHARHADLTLIGQPSPDQDDRHLARQILEASFLDSGRPALVVPYTGARSMPPKIAIIAWDGSREAARAMNDSLPLLVGADEVRLVTVDGDSLGNRVGDVPGMDATTHLARHGIKAELRAITSGGLSTSNAILAEVGDSGADLLVMGGYGHSRMREMILGGTTANLLETMTAATLLSH